MCWNGGSKLITFAVEPGHPSGFKAIHCSVSEVALTKTDTTRKITFSSCNVIKSSCVRWNDCYHIVIHKNTEEVETMAFYKADLITTITLGTLHCRLATQ